MDHAPARETHVPAGARPGPRIGFGTVRHARREPVHHAFAYPTCFLMLPLRSMRRHGDGVLARNRAALFGFRDRDHGDGSDDCLAWLDRLLDEAGLRDVDGPGAEVWLHCIPRMLGFAFKPVSFWYVHAPGGPLRAIVVEVNNTFGDRHCYLLDGDDLRFGRTLHARKVFHVSPFCRVQGDYAFRFGRTDLDATDGTGRTVVRIELHQEGRPLVVTSVSGEVRPLTRAQAWRASWTLPAMTLSIVARIHWQALRLWMKRVPFFTRPEPPARAVTR